MSATDSPLNQSYVGIHPQPTLEQELRAKWDLLMAQNEQVLADIVRKRQETRFAPWLVAFAGMTSGAALFAAGAAFVKIIG